MRRLLLIRHAKSGWDDPLLADHDRPLASRGQRAAPAIAAWLAARGHRPRLALVSSARRTQETWALMAPHFPEAELRILPRLYGAGPETIISILRHLSEEGPVAVIGHNPGIGDLAMALVGTPPAHPHFARYPTTATLVAGFDVNSWDRIGPGTGQVLDFAVPRDFEQEGRG